MGFRASQHKRSSTAAQLKQHGLMPALWPGQRTPPGGQPVPDPSLAAGNLLMILYADVLLHIGIVSATMAVRGRGGSRRNVVNAVCIVTSDTNAFLSFSS
jgi:hypothetical protein